jgi:hypothetical protein
MSRPGLLFRLAISRPERKVCITQDIGTVAWRPRRDSIITRALHCRRLQKVSEILPGEWFRRRAFRRSGNATSNSSTHAGSDDVLSVLKPLWNEKPETVSRLRGRIERVLEGAKAVLAQISTGLEKLVIFAGRPKTEGEDRNNGGENRPHIVTVTASPPGLPRSTRRSSTSSKQKRFCPGRPDRRPAVVSSARTCASPHRSASG